MAEEIKDKEEVGVVAPPSTTAPSGAVTGTQQPQEPHAGAGTGTDVDFEKQRAEAVAGSDRQIKTIQDWMNAEANRPETDEQRMRRKRREKSKRIISAFSDGLSALSNLYFTSQYAPNMYNHEKVSMTNAVDARIERAKAERERKRDQYMNFALKLGDAENGRAKTLRELEAQQEHLRLAREKAQREADQHNWLSLLQGDKRREQAGKADKAEQDARTAQAQADAAPKLQEAKIETEGARRKSYEASAAKSRASAAAHGNSNKPEFSAWDERGHEHKFRTKAAADAFAKQHGTFHEVDETEVTNTETRRTPDSKPQTRTSSKTKQGGYPIKPSPTGKPSPTSKKSPTA